MRIAYISLHWPRTKESGVGKKIISQIAFWRSQGNEVQFFSHLHEYPDEAKLIPGERFRYQTGKGLPGLVKSEFSRMGAMNNLVKSISEYRPDVIYFRSAMYVYPMHQLNAIAPVIVEINTNDVFEHRRLGWIYSTYNLSTRGINLSKVSGIVSVSKELTDAPQFTKFGKPMRVITNGFNLSETDLFPATNNENPCLVFIGTPKYPWHGIDKLVYFAETYPDINIELVGSSSIPGFERVPPNLRLHGYLKSSEYLKVLAKGDAAFGTLALHRNNMEEASPLKTRECLAHGLALIIAYKDTDLSELDAEFILKIPNTENNVKEYGQVIHDFAYRMRGYRVHHEDIQCIDYRQKEKERLEFMEEIITQQKDR